MGVIKLLILIVKLGFFLFLCYSVYIAYLTFGWQWFTLIIWVLLLFVAMYLMVKLMEECNEQH
ncbi:MAG: hypothetical protein IH934_04740 [Nanoarchaeota archaeon]|nr:hypothetical protein [Nanoarchaeota archaeon]